MTDIKDERSTPLKTIRQALKEVLRRRPRKSAVAPPLEGQGILRKANLSAPHLPQFSKISLFPDFGSSRFDIDQYSIREVVRTPPLSRDQDAQHHRRSSLLPGTRLSQYGLRQSYVDLGHTNVQKVRYEVIPEVTTELEAEIADLAVSGTQSLKSCRSTLQIRRSGYFSSSENNGGSPRTISLSRSQILRKASRSTDLRSENSSNSSRTSARAIPERSPLSTLESSFKYPKDRASVGSSQSNASIHSIAHFCSFCVLDTYIPGCPVTATSADLRYVFQVGQQFFLHLEECSGTTIDIVTGSDPAGNDVTHLVLFSPLTSVHTGKGRFMLASLIDVTNFVQDAAQVPELDTVYEDSLPEDIVSTPPPSKSQSIWTNSNHELQAEDLLGGCCLDDNMNTIPSCIQGPGTTEQAPLATDDELYADDVWLMIADEELAKQRSGEVAMQTVEARPWKTRSGRSRSRNTTNTSTSTTAVDEVLDDFMSDLQMLYSDFFLLARSPLDDNVFEICNVSPSVCAKSEYITGHLTHTSPAVVQGISERLSGGARFRVEVRWGAEGARKHLYCVPLFGQRSTTWICILVDPEMPPLW